MKCGQTASNLGRQHDGGPAGDRKFLFKLGLLAAASGHGEVVELLFEAGTDLHALDARGCTPAEAMARSLHSSNF